MKFWYVWSESAECRALRGVFGDHDVAVAHAAQLSAEYPDDFLAVVEGVVLSDLPVSVRRVRYAAHIYTNGREDTELGYGRGPTYRTWSSELMPLDTSRVGPWSSGSPDRFIEVVGSDETLVAAEYARLLAEVRQGVAKAEQ